MCSSMRWNWANWGSMASPRQRPAGRDIIHRLDKVERITGVDLASHEHRVLLYLALKMNDLIT
jgi:hypothetical protein